MTTLYTAHAISTGGRSGHVETDDKQLSYDLKQSDTTASTNPEQLFACGYAACFGSAIDAEAKKMQLDPGVITVQADVALNQDNGAYSIAVTLNVSLTGVDKAQAEQIVQAAHLVCPYSKATRGNVPVTLKVNDKALAAAA